MATGDKLADLLPMGNQPPASAFATIDTRNAQAVLDFDASTNESAVWNCGTLRNYGGNGMTVRLLCTMTSATSGNVVMSAAIERQLVGLDQITVDGFGSAVNSSATAVQSSNGTFFQVSISLSNSQVDSVSSGDRWRVRITRVANDAGDTAAGDLEMISGEIVES